MENNKQQMLNTFYSPRMVEAMNSYQYEGARSNIEREENGLYAFSNDSTDKKMLKASINGLMFALSIGKIEKVEHYINKIQDIVLDEYVLFNEIMKSALVVSFEQVNPKIASYLVSNYLIDVTSIVEELSPHTYKDKGLSNIVADFGSEKLSQFFNDCKEGKLFSVEKAIMEGVNINANNGKALRTAIASHKTDVAISLLKAGANPEVGNVFEKALKLAAISDDKSLIEAFVDVKLSTKTKNEGLLIAIKHQDLKSVERLLISGASATYENNVALAIAVDYSTKEIIKTLVDFGADIYSNNCIAIEKALKLKRDDVVREVFSDKLMGIREVNKDVINAYTSHKMRNGEFTDVVKLIESGLNSEIIFDNQEKADILIFKREVSKAYNERRNQGIEVVPLKQVKNRDWETNKVHSLKEARRGKDLKFGSRAM